MQYSRGRNGVSNIRINCNLMGLIHRNSEFAFSDEAWLLTYSSRVTRKSNQYISFNSSLKSANTNTVTQMNADCIRKKSQFGSNDYKESEYHAGNLDSIAEFYWLAAAF